MSSPLFLSVCRTCAIEHSVTGHTLPIGSSQKIATFAGRNIHIIPNRIKKLYGRQRYIDQAGRPET